MESKTPELPTLKAPDTQEGTKPFFEFLISELRDLLENDSLPEEERETAFHALAKTVEKLEKEERFRSFVKLGQKLGVKLQSAKVLHAVCRFAEDYIKHFNNTIDTYDRIAITLIHASSCFEIYQITRQESFLNCSLVGFQNIQQILNFFPQLDLFLTSSHFDYEEKSSEPSTLESSVNYNTIGRAYLEAYYLSKENEHIFLAQKFLEKALYLYPTNSLFKISYAELLITLGDRTGSSKFAQKAVSLLSSAIFQTFNRFTVSPLYTRGRYLYARALEMLFRLTYCVTYFNKANEAFREIAQESPSNENLWLLWGSMLISFGIFSQNPMYVESGLDKLSFLKGKTTSPMTLTRELAVGIAVLGLYLEEPTLFQESKYRIISTLKLFPENIKLLPALGVTQLCDAIYFSDDEKFSVAISCLLTALEDDETVDVLERLFDAYLAWGMQKKSSILLKKGLAIAERLCQLRPEVFIFWRDRGKILFLLAKYMSDTPYAELFLEESLLYYSKAWELSQEESVLEAWGITLRELGALKKNKDLYNQALNFFHSLQKESRHHLKYTLELVETYISLAENLASPESAEKAVTLLNAYEVDRRDDEDVLLLLGRAYLLLSIEKDKAFSRVAEKTLIRCVEKGCLEALYPLSKLYATLGEKDRAIKLFHKALDSGSDISWSQVQQDKVFDKMNLKKVFSSALRNKQM
ncbi:tetratricopeptide repeat protein [Chlamydiifrater phoenicopteri]|uniref:tetratricopeptide repeat protein n=1 Tax=Chlamydiifrater phoenicopteri TaxID=2681469 RepID=UPI001BD19ECE|nr:hypothetical protein [Chlamydiifrater phoenicopteri]